MREIEAKLVVEAQANPGEGPIWHDGEQVLYWLDISHGLVHRYDPSTGKDTSVDVGQSIGALVPRASGGFVAAVRDGFAAVDVTSGALEMIAIVDDNPHVRFNDGKCDRHGRFWAGTMAVDATPGAGALYCLEPDGTVTCKIEPVTVSNGLAWSSDDHTMYYIDSLAYSVSRYQYEPSTGKLGLVHQHVAIDPSLGLPDGCAIDADDHLWVAIHNSSQVRRYTPSGMVDAIVHVPAKGVTSVCFAGAGLSDLYITTAHTGPGDIGGSLFVCDPQVTGTPTLPYRG